jgi:DNA-binding transcriptional ArsR family regulator
VNAISLDQLAQELGAEPQPGGAYKAKCRFCESPHFWLTDRGFSCHTCNKQGPLDSLQSNSRHFEFFTPAEIQNRPRPEPLIGDILPARCLAAIYGPPGSGKTFLALDWAFSLGSGVPWHGRGLEPARVVYVSAEGVSGLGPRIAAWRKHRGVEVGGEPAVSFVLDAVQLLDGSEVDRFVADVQAALEAPPVLIVFDTLARCLIGSDENSAKDMGLAIANADRIRRTLGCAVLLVHHTNANGERERGSTALRGAVDVLHLLKATGRAHTLTCEKAKDSAAFDPIEFELRQVSDSAVLTPISRMGVSGFNISVGAVEALRSLSQAALPEGLSITKWEEVANLSPSTFYRHRKALWDGGFVTRDKEARGALYRLTEKGERVLTPITSTHSQEPGSNAAPSLPPTASPLGEARIGSDHENESGFPDYESEENLALGRDGGVEA